MVAGRKDEKGGDSATGRRGQDGEGCRQFLRRRWKKGGIFYDGDGKNAVYIRSSMW